MRNPNLLAAILTILTLSKVVLSYPDSGCHPNTQINMLYSDQISIVRMHKAQDLSNPHRIFYQYLYRIPQEYLMIAKSSKLQSIITINQIQWKYNPRFIKYQIMKIVQELAILIKFSSEMISWQTFRLKILLNDQEHRPQIYFGHFTYSQTIIIDSTVIKAVTLPQSPKFNKFVSFITGIHASLQSPFYELYEISVRQSQQSGEILTFSLQVGNNTNLHSISISYIAISENEPANEYLVSGSITFGSTNSGQSFVKLQQSLPINQIYLFGLSEFKAKQAYRPFGFDFNNVYNNLFSLKLIKPVEYLTVRYFGISVAPSKICKDCEIYGTIFSEKVTTLCLPKCPSDTVSFQSPNNTFKMCSICHQQLKMQLRDGVCSCKPGYNQYQGRCVESSYFQAFKSELTFSTKESFCVDDKNMVYNGQSCVCKPGFQINNIGGCTSICAYGYWDDQSNQCVYCNVNTYPYQELKQCRSCGDYCLHCQSINTCAFCQTGFQPINGLCQQICGDGIKIVKDCDDGNLDNNDGCSSTCKVQSHFECKGGSVNSKDVCSFISYQISREAIEKTENGLLLVIYVINPPLARHYGLSELANMIYLSIQPQQTGNSYNQYSFQNVRTKFYHDPNNLDRIQIAIDFSNNAPTFDLLINIFFNLERGRPFQDIFNVEFQSDLAAARMGYRGIT